ncbi:MAG: hypothetical protein QG604_326 [Candidatus Dependentiae bacterium]|nr:hypothetical protein [Candidatus Dependentiae bacterium]
MKKHAMLMISIFALMCMSHALQADIELGNESGVVLLDGILNLNSAQLTGGLIKKTGGTLSGTPVCSETRIVVDTADEQESMVVTGSVTIGSSITLGDDQMMELSGLPVAEQIIVNGTLDHPSVLQGLGSTFNNSIQIGNDKAVLVNISGDLAASIALASGDGYAAKLVLGADLHLAPEYFVTSHGNGGADIVDFAGYSLYIGGNQWNNVYFDNNLIWYEPNLFLTGPVTLSSDACITFGDDGYVNGNGNQFTFGGGSSIDGGECTVTFINCVLTNISSGTFVGQGMWRFVNCYLVSEDGYNSIFINGSMTAREDSGYVIDVFGGNAIFSNTTIELKNNLTIAGTWTFNGDSIVNGNGYRLNLSTGVFDIATGVLALSNLFLTSLSADMFDFSGGSMTWSNMNVTLSETVDWSVAGGGINVTGPLTVITGSHHLIMKSSSIISSAATVWYDTLGSSDDTNITGFDLAHSDGRVAQLTSGAQLAVMQGAINAMDSDITTIFNDIDTLSDDIDALKYVSDYTYLEGAGLSKNIYLYPEVPEVTNGSRITFGGAAAYTLDGCGRSIIFGDRGYSLFGDPLLYVYDATQVTLKNIILDGLLDPWWGFEGGEDWLHFGDNTTVVLRKNWTDEVSQKLGKEMTFGSGASNERMYINLQGHDIDFSHVNAAIVLDSGSGSELHISDGRLLNLSGSKLSASTGNVLVLHNVELVLSNDFNWASGQLRFEGNCIISGVADAVFNNTSVEGLSIMGLSSLQLRDGIIYDHNHAGTSDFILNDATAILELIGAVFRRSDREDDPLLLSTGILRIDHRSFIRPGSAGICFNNTPDSSGMLTIVLRPSAQLVIDTDDAAGPGSLAYIALG